MSDQSLTLQENIVEAFQQQQAVQIIGGNTKFFYGRTPSGKPLNVSEHSGITNYEPTELVITARGGTKLSEIESLLAENNQMLAFEPPYFGKTATLGGTIACNLSGPRRPYAGAARDYVLGITLLNGKGEILHFGGEVMKNVAGYDVSRLMAGAMGTMGILLEISLKVLPCSDDECTLIKELDEASALKSIAHYSRKALPISASLYDGNKLYIRLCGTSQSVAKAKQKIGGDTLPAKDNFWQIISEHRHAFFNSDMPLWRLSVAPNTRPLRLDGKSLLDWGGAQRWLLSEEPIEKIQHVVEKEGGHAVLFRNGDHDGEVFQVLPEKMLHIHRELKRAFDPESILNPGRMYKVL